jgi:hypothetical protein
VIRHRLGPGHEPCDTDENRIRNTSLRMGADHALPLSLILGDLSPGMGAPSPAVKFPVWPLYDHVAKPLMHKGSFVRKEKPPTEAERLQKG